MTGATLAPIALTMGEPAGIGGEITLMAWRAGGVPPFAVLDDPDRLTALAGRLGLDVPCAAISDISQVDGVFGTALPVLPVRLPVAVAPGRPDTKAGAAVIESIDRAVALAMDGSASAIVTNPINKAALYQAGFRDPGHTEYLGRLAGLDRPPIMMLASDTLRVVPVTIHVSLATAIAALSEDEIVRTAEVTAAALKSDFGIARPRLAVAGLNPHAGEDGHMGTEDRDIVAPAIARLRAAGIDSHGPLPPDTMFHAAARERYDAAICMYHDQALIPIKTLDFAGAVNVTLGLPFIRTSPDHGTAFDIAGTGAADPASLIAALALAGRMATQRAATERALA